MAIVVRIWATLRASGREILLVAENVTWSSLFGFVGFHPTKDIPLGQENYGSSEH